MATFLILLCVLFLVFLAVLSIIQDRKKGIGSCGNNCNSCASGGICHDKKGILQEYYLDHPSRN